MKIKFYLLSLTIFFSSATLAQEKIYNCNGMFQTSPCPAVETKKALPTIKLPANFTQCESQGGNIIDSEDGVACIFQAPNENLEQCLDAGGSVYEIGQNKNCSLKFSESK